MMSYVECDACGESVKYTSNWVWMQMLKDRQVVTARICFMCARQALLIPGVDARSPPMEPDTPADAEPSRWRWLYINTDLPKRKT
jgi:hypothetical protein